MDIDLGIRINAYGSGGSGQSSSGGQRRSRHQEKLKALLHALQRHDLANARLAFKDLLGFNPSLADSSLKRVGDALASANLSAARKAFEDIYGQNPLIFGKPIAATPTTPPPSLRDGHGVLVDTCA